MVGDWLMVGQTLWLLDQLGGIPEASLWHDSISQRNTIDSLTRTRPAGPCIQHDDDALYGPLIVHEVIYYRHVMPALGEKSSISSLSNGHEHELL